MNHCDHPDIPNSAKREAALAEGTLAGMLRANARDLYRYACWLCLDPTGAEHLVIETFAHAPASLLDASTQNARRWQLFSLVRRQHGPPDVTHTRSSCQRQEHPAGAHDGGSDGTLRLREQMQQLPNQQLEPLVLQALNFSVVEIAQIVDATPHSVTSHLRQARAWVAQAHR